MSYRLVLTSETPIRLEDGGVVTPPVTPPPVVPPVTPPPENNDPFVWPAQPYIPDRDDQRYAALGLGFYVGAPNCMNPIGASGKFAGYVLDPKAKVGQWEIYGWRVWAPNEAQPYLIRRAIRDGSLGTGV